jgi:hypothetical protein
MTLEQLTKECLIKRSKVENEATETQGTHSLTYSLTHLTTYSLTHSLKQNKWN